MILVTGSTGLVGRHLLLALLAKGKKVRALYRDDHKKEEVEAFFAFAKAKPLLEHISWVQGDITDVPRLGQIFKGITRVYHCAALISFNPYDFKKLTKINIEGTANIVNLCLSQGIKKLIHLSSIATLVDQPHTPITEENYWDPNADNSVYGLTKYGAEMEVWRGTQEGLNALIFNPGIILGEGNYKTGSGAIFQHVLREKAFYPSATAAVIDVKDLVALMSKAMDTTLTAERYIAVGHHIQYKDLFSSIAQTLEKKSPRFPLQNWWFPFLVFIDSIAGFFTRKRRLTRRSVKALQYSKRYDTQKLVKTFLYEPSPLEETIERIGVHLTKTF